MLSPAQVACEGVETDVIDGGWRQSAGQLPAVSHDSQKPLPHLSEQAPAPLQAHMCWPMPSLVQPLADVQPAYWPAA